MAAILVEVGELPGSIKHNLLIIQPLNIMEKKKNQLSLAILFRLSSLTGHVKCRCHVGYILLLYTTYLMPDYNRTSFPLQFTFKFGGEQRLAGIVLDSVFRLKETPLSEYTDTYYESYVVRF